MKVSELPVIGVHAHRIYSDYLEMPGLRLTGAQAQRLWGLEAGICADALRALVEAGFLRRTDAGQYVRLTEGSTGVPLLRMAKAALPQTTRTRAVI
jgi:hypothetical protein